VHAAPIMIPVEDLLDDEADRVPSETLPKKEMGR
jgi:hypothetical protein